MNKECKIKGWIAKNGVSKRKSILSGYDNKIVFSKLKPIRDEQLKHWKFVNLCLDSEAFSNLKWENEPIEVELIIKIT